MKTNTFVLVVVALIALFTVALAIIDSPDLEVFGGPVATGTPYPMVSGIRTSVLYTPESTPIFDCPVHDFRPAGTTCEFIITALSSDGGSWGGCYCITPTPDPTGTPTFDWQLEDVILDTAWVWTTLDQGGFAIDSNGTITITDPFARAMRDAIEAQP